MQTVRWFWLVGAALIVVVGAVAASISSDSGPTAPTGSMNARPVTDALTGPDVISTGGDASVVDGAEEAVVGVCDLLALAAQADPARHYGVGRSTDDIVVMVALQRELLLAAAEQLGPGPQAAALTELAGAFIDSADPTGPGAWTELQWADALIVRADPTIVSALDDLESSC